MPGAMPEKLQLGDELVLEQKAKAPNSLRLKESLVASLASGGLSASTLQGGNPVCRPASLRPGLAPARPPKLRTPRKPGLPYHGGTGRSQPLLGRTVLLPLLDDRVRQPRTIALRTIVRASPPRLQQKHARCSLSTAPLFASEEGLSATQIDRAPPSPLEHDSVDCLRSNPRSVADRVAMHGRRAFLVGQRPPGPTQ